MAGIEAKKTNPGMQEHEESGKQKVMDFLSTTGKVSISKS